MPALIGRNNSTNATHLRAIALSMLCILSYFPDHVSAQQPDGSGQEVKPPSTSGSAPAPYHIGKPSRHAPAGSSTVHIGKPSRHAPAGSSAVHIGKPSRHSPDGSVAHIGKPSRSKPGGAVVHIGKPSRHAPPGSTALKPDGSSVTEKRSGSELMLHMPAGSTFTHDPSVSGTAPRQPAGPNVKLHRPVGSTLIHIPAGSKAKAP